MTRLLQILVREISEVAARRVRLIQHVAQMHDGNVYWLNTIFLEKKDIDRYFGNKGFQHKIHTYHVLGHALSSLTLPLAPEALEDYFKNYLSVLNNWEAAITRDLWTPRMKALFSARSFRKSSLGIEGRVLDEEKSLVLPHVAFTPSYTQTILALCDLLREAYTVMMNFISSGGAYHRFIETFYRVDHKTDNLRAGPVPNDTVCRGEAPCPLFSQIAQSTEPAQITKNIKHIPSKNPPKEECISVDAPKTSFQIPEDSHSQKLLEMLSNHFHDLQNVTHDRCKKDLFSLAEKTIQTLSDAPNDPTFQHMQCELENAQADCTFIMNQEKILQEAQQRLITCLKEYTKEAKQIQTEIQTLLLPTGPFELTEDIWTDIDALLEEANILTDKYLHKMKNSMQKCNEVDQEHKRKLMNQLF
ncbi:hypothetical protein PORY_001238 [Pneumocystis oryctolagi]|uniref:Uncharacterized protein n=1 Tax=Pneumocystis oryctolagi TaxID=42067 RepID=A0ACB7CBW6_9ASCO|nr:hypothetical protein PORY_001238 [Pneumocystis oryctolagi]